ncbi:MAG: amidophosphoribosyltransferase, partial [Gammaproteobacteria bacterium]|nr:amidophosphoribosyltransferase [Gammaproteobacteria bacterium]
MCGIVGLLIKNQGMQAQLGQLVTPMLTSMSERGPDSAGLAIFSAADEGEKFSLFCQAGEVDWATLADTLSQALGRPASIEAQGCYARLGLDTTREELKPLLDAQDADIH